MKNILFFFLLILLVKTTLAQHDDNNPLPYVHREPQFDTAPRFPGGPQAMMKYFEDSIRYPEPEWSKNIQGNVLVKFDVSKKGKVINIHLVNGVAGGPNLAGEAVRVLEAIPLWIPAVKNKKRVEAECFLAVPFKIKKQEIRKRH